MSTPRNPNPFRGYVNGKLLGVPNEPQWFDSAPRPEQYAPANLFEGAEVRTSLALVQLRKPRPASLCAWRLPTKSQCRHRPPVLQSGHPWFETRANLQTRRSPMVHANGDQPWAPLHQTHIVRQGDFPPIVELPKPPYQPDDPAFVAQFQNDESLPPLPFRAESATHFQTTETPIIKHAVRACSDLQLKDMSGPLPTRSNPSRI